MTRLKTAALCSLSGALLWLSFPKPNLWPAAWIALVPLLIAIQDASWIKVFFRGWLAGTIGFTAILYWLVPTFAAAQAPIALACFALLLLASYIGLYFGLFALAAEYFRRRFPEPAFLIFSAAAWTALEWVRGCFLTGFPWALLGYSQWRAVPLIQISEWTGVYGVSAFLAISNLTLFTVWKKRKLAPVSAAFLLLPLALNFILYYRVPVAYLPKKEVEVTLLQGNIDQYKKWDEAYVQEILNSYGGLAPASAKSDLVVWPETSVPGWVPMEAWLMQWIQKTVIPTGAYHFIGAVTKRDGRNFNAGFLIDPGGRIASSYDKIKLVPFGEFVPLESLLGRWVAALNELGRFSSGEQPGVIETPAFKFAPTICYESIFPERVRKEVKSGAELIVNITNDGWYLDTAAPLQHFSMNVFRAVENRRSLVRAANTGISGVIGPDGRVLKRTALNEKTLLRSPVSLIAEMTFYSRHGDVFAGACAALALGGWIAGLFWKRNFN